MSDLRFEYPDAFAAEIERLWTSEDISKQGADRPLGPLPSSEGLQRFVSCCYQASLKREEDRPLRFRAVYFPRSGTGDEHIDSWQLHHQYSFKSARPVTPGSLRKIAPACDLEKAVMLIDEPPKPTSSQLEVWGLLHDDSNWRDAETGDSAFIGTLNNNSLCLYVLGPGQISAACGGRVFLRLENGRIQKPAAEVYNSEWLLRFFEAPISEILEECATRHSQQPEAFCDIDSWPIFARYMLTVKRLVHGVASHGHGGSIVLLPSDDCELVAVRASLAIQFELARTGKELTLFSAIKSFFHMLTQPGLKRAGKERERYLEQKLDRHSYIAYVDVDPTHSTRQGMQRIASLVQWTAALSQVDGSLVLNRRLEPV